MIVAVVRDLLIIFLALTSIVVWVLLGILIWQIWRLTKMVQTEIKPLIADTQETVATVRGTANFMSENVVAPVIQTSSRVTQYRRTAMTLFGQYKAAGAAYPTTKTTGAASAFSSAPGTTVAAPSTPTAEPPVAGS